MATESELLKRIQTQISDAENRISAERETIRQAEYRIAVNTDVINRLRLVIGEGAEGATGNSPSPVAIAVIAHTPSFGGGQFAGHSARRLAAEFYASTSGAFTPSEVFAYVRSKDPEAKRQTVMNVLSYDFRRGILSKPAGDGLYLYNRNSRESLSQETAA